jgi:predicted small lipoprotein YifL
MTVRLLMAAALIGALAVAGCGRKGDLDTPYEANQEARELAEEEGRPLPPERAPPVKDRRFILDGLIE